MENKQFMGFTKVDEQLQLWDQMENPKATVSFFAPLPDSVIFNEAEKNEDFDELLNRSEDALDHDKIMIDSGLSYNPDLDVLISTHANVSADNFTQIPLAAGTALLVADGRLVGVRVVGAKTMLNRRGVDSTFLR